jgi:hypothetical protein
MKTHTLIGVKVLEDSSRDLKRYNKDYFGMSIDITLNHHEIMIVQVMLMEKRHKIYPCLQG